MIYYDGVISNDVSWYVIKRYIFDFLPIFILKLIKMKEEMSMKVIKAFGPKDLRVVDVSMPEPDPGSVRIKVRASGICGSDKWVWNVNEETDSIAGHEVAGVVEKLGEGVTSLSVGDRVSVNNVIGCGQCAACIDGAFVYCIDCFNYPDVNNGFGEYVIAPVRNCLILPSGLDFIDGALIMDNWGTPYGGIKRADIKENTDVLITGCGPIGQAAIKLLKVMGCRVFAADPIEWRREFALTNGADYVFAPDELPDAVLNITNGKGVHVAMECSGNGAAYDICLRSLQCLGNVVSIGEGAEFMFRPSDDLIHRGRGILGTWYSSMPQVKEIVQLALDGRINLKSFLTHTVTLDEVPDIFDSVVNSEDGYLKCVIVFE